MSFPFPFFRRACAAIVLLGAAGLRAETTPSSAWLSFDPGVSPVARPLDALFWAPNAATASDRVASSFFGESHGAAWRVKPRAGWEEASGGKWATLGFALPGDGAKRVRGIRVRARVEDVMVLSCEFYGGLSKTRGFYGAPVMGRAQKALREGRQEIVFLFAGAGVPAAGRDGVGGARLMLNAAPAGLVIEGVDLLFADEAAAKEFSASEAAKRETNLATMQTWLAARGVELAKPAGDRAQWEARGWQAAQLIAMGEQLAYWRELLAAKRPQAPTGRGAELESARLRQMAELKAGRALGAELEALQRAVDELVEAGRATLTLAERRWTVGEDTRFYYPSGKPYRMFGPFFFRAIYSPTSGMDKLWRPWDMRYLAALGFNGIRLPVQWNRIEPTRGEFDPQFLQVMKDIMREAESYGLGVSIDLHWPYPDWFKKGKPGFEPDPKDSDSENSYHWPEALVDSWARLAAEFADVPNIVAFEVPTNETPIAKGPKGVLAYPTLMASWNEWLRTHYKTRAALAAAWGEGPAALADDETWETRTIRPLGFQGDANADAAYAGNPRLWDHLRWTAWMQEDVTTKIMAAIRRSSPGAVGIMQRTIGDAWDRSPVPIDYNSLQTLVGEHVWPGTHYGMGGLSARKARVYSLGNYDSEQQMENARAQVERHVRLGLGFSPFAFHARGGGGMLFRDDTWHLKPEVAYLPEMADWIRNHWPEPEADAPRGAVALIENTRLAATSKRGTMRAVLDALLAQGGARVDVFEGLRVVREPGLLKNYDAVITEAAFMDADLIEVLDRHFRGRVLLFGGVARDAFARGAAASPAAELARRGWLFAPEVARTGALATGGDADSGDGLDLTGFWDWAFVGERAAAPAWDAAERARVKEWRPMQVPGLWGEKELLGTREFQIGDAWYRKTITVPAAWKGRALSLDIGAIDDVDWVFLNGRLVGHTGQAVSEYWMARRQYAIDPALVNWGGENEIVIAVRNLRDDAGIWKGPVTLGGAKGWTLRGLPGWKPGPDADASFVLDPEAKTTRGALHPAAKVAATFARDGGEVAPALVSHGRWHWWAADLTLSSAQDANALVLRWFLPPTAQPAPKSLSR